MTNQHIEITDEFVKKKVSTGRQYILVHLIKGPKYESDPESADEIQKAHLRFLFKLKEEGKLLLVGPLMEKTDLRGIAIYNIQEPEEVKKIASEDPAVQAGLFTIEIYRWFGIPGDGLPL
ncbi:MAG: YciI family protein [Ignavibacteria bacterium]|jgi:uncharacterized protein YciI